MVQEIVFEGQMSWLAKINRTFFLVTKTIHQTFTYWGFWEILFYADTLIVYNLHIKILKLRVYIPAALGCRISEITDSSTVVHLSHVAPAV